MKRTLKDVPPYEPGVPVAKWLSKQPLENFVMSPEEIEQQRKAREAAEESEVKKKMQWKGR
jgi:hypothetical protein